MENTEETGSFPLKDTSDPSQVDAGAPPEQLKALQERILDAAVSDVGMPPATVAGILFGLAQAMLDTVESPHIKRASLLACISNCQDQLIAIHKKHGAAKE